MSLERIAHAQPECSDLISKISHFSAGKLYHELTGSLLALLKHLKPQSDRLQVFNEHVDPIASFMNPVKVVEAVRLLTLDTSDDCRYSLQLLTGQIAPIASAFTRDNRDAHILALALQAELQLRSDQVVQSRETLDIAEKQLKDAQWAFGLCWEAHSEMKRVSASYYKRTGDTFRFFEESVQYLSFTPVAEIPETARPSVAFEVSIADLISPKVHDFGKLLLQPLLHAPNVLPDWLMKTIVAFDRGDIVGYQAQRSHLESLPELQGNAAVLNRKICEMALLELATNQPSPRLLSFVQIAQACRLPSVASVEPLVLHALAEGLVRGSVDQVAGEFRVDFVQPRLLDLARLQALRARLDHWAQQTQKLAETVEGLASADLLSAATVVTTK